MNFFDYVEYRCMTLNKIAQETGIGYGYFRNRRCPANLSPEQIELLKLRIGDWESVDLKAQLEKEEEIKGRMNK